MEDVISSAKKLRKRAGKSSDSVKRVYSGNMNADWTFSYKPSSREIVIAIRPDDGEEQTARQIASEVSGHFGRNTPTLTKEDAGAVIEFVGSFEWSPM